MLITFALALLLTWLVSVLLFSSAGDAVHVLLLIGLALLLLGLLRARDRSQPSRPCSLAAGLRVRRRQITVL